jgi:SAM-dependent methyltransferase
MEATMELADWVPEGIDLSRPSVARAYDYTLGGGHNLAIDREFADRLMAAVPDMRITARANRAFLHRAVRFLVQAGVRQFLDIGSGIPTVGNVHEIAQEAAPDARVVYVDIDPVAVAHSQRILAGNSAATAIQADLRHPEIILGHPQVRALLDFDQPIGLMLVAILHAVPDSDDPVGVVAQLRDVLRSGSYLAVSHATADRRPDDMGEVTRMFRQTTTPTTTRTRAEILRFFDGFDLVEPGLVWSPQWRPDSPEDVGEHPERMMMYVGVGRKP